MRFLMRAVVAVVLLAAILYGIGMTMPREHSATSRIQLTTTRDSVWAVLRDFGAYPSWDSDFTSSVRGTSRNGHEVWVQEAGGMTMSMELTLVSPPTRLVSEVVTDETSAWGGVWTYDLVANGAGTEVTITEDGWVKSPIFRVLMKVRGTYATMDGVLGHLGAKFGEEVSPQHLK